MWGSWPEHSAHRLPGGSLGTRELQISESRTWFWGKGEPSLVGWFQGSAEWKRSLRDLPPLSLAGAPAGTISWPSMWNTGLPGGPPLSLRYSGQPFATGTSCCYWRPMLMARTLDSHFQGLRGR